LGVCDGAGVRGARECGDGAGGVGGEWEGGVL